MIYVDAGDKNLYPLPLRRQLCQGEYVLIIDNCPTAACKTARARGTIGVRPGFGKTQSR